MGNLGIVMAAGKNGRAGQNFFPAMLNSKKIIWTRLDTDRLLELQGGHKTISN
jgi:hypothetical protein